MLPRHLFEFIEFMHIEKTLYFMWQNFLIFFKDCNGGCLQIVKYIFYSAMKAKGGFFSESAMYFSNLPISQRKIFHKTVLSLKFEFVVYNY